MFPEAFYQTMAQLCFTLLGLWWLVLQTKYREWIGNARSRRRITNISLYFLLPGSMSLLSLLADNVRAVWQTAFVIASVLGAIEAAFLFRDAANTWRARAPLVLAVVLYAVIAVVAVVPDAFRGVGLTPLTVEGIVQTLLVVLGLILAWVFFLEPTKPDPPDKPAEATGE